MKCKCLECDWLGPDTEVLVAVNPFDAEDQISGCPQCKSVETLRVACDVPGCDELASCGWNDATGRRTTCGQHMEQPGDEK